MTIFFQLSHFLFSKACTVISLLVNLLEAILSTWLSTASYISQPLAVPIAPEMALRTFTSSEARNRRALHGKGV
jgi:hypothetical protein